MGKSSRKSASEVLALWRGVLTHSVMIVYKICQLDDNVLVCDMQKQSVHPALCHMVGFVQDLVSGLK